MPHKRAGLPETHPDLASASELMGPAPPFGANRDPRQDVAYGPGGEPELNVALLAQTGHPVAARPPVAAGPAEDQREVWEALGHA